MMHYLFTNDLRISVLNTALIDVAKMVQSDSIPSAAVDKSVNNNAKTLAFYFNLVKGGECAKLAAEGQTRRVVLNFIKKYQYPNLRTPESYSSSRADGIVLAPMRQILKLLYIAFLSDGNLGYITRDEMRDFVFYNTAVAKVKIPNIIEVYSQIKEYRHTKTLPGTIVPENEREWKHEDRQIREMVKVLLWSGCVSEDDSKYKIVTKGITESEKADIFEIVSFNSHWEGGDKDSYEAYMEMDAIKSNAIIAFKNRESVVSIEDRVLDKYDEIKDELPNFGKYYKEFCDKFSPEMLQSVDGEELLKYIFLSSDNKDNMCWWLEFNKEVREYFGSIRSGTAYKYGLFYSQDKGAWVTGSSQKPQVLTLDEAIALGTDVRNKLVGAAKYIANFGEVTTIEEYIVIDKKINEIMGDANKVWIQKYLHMIFPHLFATFTNDEWQKHVLFSCGLTPKEGRYVRSGQISLFATGLGISNAAFAQVVYQLFGGVKHFYRLGTSDASSNYFSEWVSEKYAAVGWTGLGNLSTLTDKGELKKDAILDKMTEYYYPDDSRTASRKAGEICTFYNTNTEDSYYVAMEGKTLLALGKVGGEYYLDSSKPLGHCKAVEWIRRFKNEELPSTEGLRTTCVEIDDNENLLFLYNALNDNNAVFEAETESEIEEETMEMIERKPRENKTHDLNCIIYGAPGTGKTYSTAEYAIDVCENKKTTFKQLTSEERAELMKKYEQLVSEGRVVFTTFHQSFGYEDFIQGLRPDIKADGMKFKTVDGVFKKIADRAMTDTENDYVLIIDEINRGNISKIFGELITLIEDDKRWGEANQLSAILPSGQKFAVPNNLYIVGTMNSADKSISLIDTALRRRFAFVEKAPDASILSNSKMKGVLLGLNKYIKNELRSTDLLIGHAFFIGKEESDLEEIMNNHIIPLLYEYFFDDENKVKKALDCLDGSQYEIDKDYPGRIRVRAKVE